MSVKKIISYEVPTLLPGDSGGKAMELMEEHKLNHIPIVANEQYLALIKEDDILDWDTPDQPLSQSDLLRYSPAIFADGHPFEAIRLSYDQNLSVVPIVDADNNYIGAVTRETMLSYVAEHSGLESPGGVIVLEIDPLDYRLYDIVRICESEDVSVITTQLFTNKQTGKLELTIKTNRSNLESLAATYERFGIKVLELYSEHTNRGDMMDRYNLLMAYINM